MQRPAGAISVPAPAFPHPPPTLFILLTAALPCVGVLQHGDGWRRVDGHPAQGGRQPGLPEDVEGVQDGETSGCPQCAKYPSNDLINYSDTLIGTYQGTGLLEPHWFNQGGVGPPCISYAGCTLSDLRPSKWNIPSLGSPSQMFARSSSAPLKTRTRHVLRDSWRETPSVIRGLRISVDAIPPRRPHSMTSTPIGGSEGASWKLKWKDKHGVRWSGGVGGDAGRWFHITTVDPKLGWIAFRKSFLFQSSIRASVRTILQYISL